MGRFTTTVLLLFLFIYQPGRCFSPEGAVEILQVSVKIFSELFGIWQEIGNDKQDVPLPFRFANKENRIVNQINQVSRSVEELSKELQRTTETTIHTISTKMPEIVQLELIRNDLSNAIATIDSTYEEMANYIKVGYVNTSGTEPEWKLERLTLESLATYIVSHNPDSVRGLLEKIHLLIAPYGNRLVDRGILVPLRKSMQESGTNVCNLQQSPQQLLYNLYTTVALTELKGYAMMQFSWMLLKLYNKGNFTTEALIMRQRFMDRTMQKITAVKYAMKGASRELWHCDPKHHIRNETYVEVTQLLQGHIQNEVDMNSESTCRENCGYYSYAKSRGCYQNLFCSKQPKCNGKLIDCRYIDSDMWVCLSDNMQERRYNWVEYENGRVLGQKGTCKRGSTKVDSWWRWLFWHCSYCFCLCDEQGPKSDRYFNLRRVTADVDNNMAVTGVRFVKVNRVIHLQIQQASIVPHGGINTSSVHWKPVDDYKISDIDVRNGEDYHTLSWEQRAIDLDDLIAPEGHVLTGIRFRRVGTHLNPEIMVTPLNFTEGTLIKPKEKSIWIGNDNTDASLISPRTRLDIRNPDVPIRSYSSRPDSKSDQFLLFTHSDIDTDAAQTTVPFIDAQPVVPDPPTLLGGAGVYHKGQSGYGGFIALKVITYNYTSHITADFFNDVNRKKRHVK